MQIIFNSAKKWHIFVVYKGKSLLHFKKRQHKEKSWKSVAALSI